MRSRRAEVGDKLIVTNFGCGTRGFACESDPEVAVCVLPGTEIAFSKDVTLYGPVQNVPHRAAIFRQVNKEDPLVHHDALEFPDGRRTLLTLLCEGQEGTVLQLPVVLKRLSLVEHVRALKEQGRIPYEG